MIATQCRKAKRILLNILQPSCLFVCSGNLFNFIVNFVEEIPQQECTFVHQPSLLYYIRCRLAKIPPSLGTIQESNKGLALIVADKRANYLTTPHSCLFSYSSAAVGRKSESGTILKKKQGTVQEKKCCFTQDGQDITSSLCFHFRWLCFTTIKLGVSKAHSFHTGKHGGSSIILSQFTGTPS